MSFRLTHLVLLVLLVGCASNQLHRESADLFAEGRTEEALLKLEQASKNRPDDLMLRTELIRQRNSAINDWLRKADEARAVSAFDEAEENYKRVLQFDPNNDLALKGLTTIKKARRSEDGIQLAQTALNQGNLEKAESLTETMLEYDPANKNLLALKDDINDAMSRLNGELPTLRSIYRKPVSLEFRDANLKMVFQLLSKDTGINFVLDKEVRSDLKTTIFIKRAALEDAVDLLLSTNQLEKKVLDQNTVLIYPNTAAKIKEYQDLVLKGFYISSADVKQVQAMIKSMLNAKNVSIDERLNLLLIRDTPETVRLAEKIIAMQDISEPEVMLEVEVLEVQRSHLQALGIQFPDQLTLAPLSSNGQNLTLDDLKNLNSSRIGASISPLVINAKKQDDAVNLLANPRIRARNHEKAKILIGDKVPVITTTSTSTGFVSESVQYVDVGLKLEMEPDIYQNNDIAIKIDLEVSNIVKEVRSNTGTLTYQIGTRNASSLLQLKDGETQVLAGLINNQDNHSASKVPGLGDIPILGRLFSSRSRNQQKTEIVLSITPHLIRNIRRPEESLGFWTGTDERLRTRPMVVRTDIEVAANDAAMPPAPQSDSGANETLEAHQETTISAVNEPGIAGESKVVTLAWQAPPSVKVGEEFKATLAIKSKEGLKSLPLQLGFDPKILQVLEVTEGDFFKQNVAKTISNSNIDQIGGRVFTGIARTETEEGAAGEASLLTVTFKVIAPAAQTEIKVIAATPIPTSKAQVTSVLPPPLLVQISKPEM